jgi:hypothetical protein
MHVGYFWDRVSWTVCWDWLQTAILLIFYPLSS